MNTLEYVHMQPWKCENVSRKYERDLNVIVLYNFIKASI